MYISNENNWYNIYIFYAHRFLSVAWRLSNEDSQSDKRQGVPLHTIRFRSHRTIKRQKKLIVIVAEYFNLINNN